MRNPSPSHKPLRRNCAKISGLVDSTVKGGRPWSKLAHRQALGFAHFEIGIAVRVGTAPRAVGGCALYAA